MNNQIKKKKYGIWGGRFHIIHKSHEYIAQYVSENYDCMCVVIVNPDPMNPVWIEFERFKPQLNPFTYFQRLFLWNKVLKNLNINGAVIVPNWHPRKSLELETTFLPWKKEREWVIPDIREEEYKIDDLKKLGELVKIIDILSSEMESMNATKIRNSFRAYSHNIPESIRDETEKMLERAKHAIIGYTSEDFIVVPITQDLIHPALICAGIQRSFDSGKKVIFAPIVHVRDCDDWFRQKCDDTGFLSFFDKYTILNNILECISFYDYLVSPILVKGGKCISIDSFLPAGSTWLFIRPINTAPDLFRDYCEEYDSYCISDLNLSAELVFDIYIYSTILLDEKGYYAYSRDRFYDK